MGAARTLPPPTPEAPIRAKTLRLADATHVRSEVRREARRESRGLVLRVMHESKAMTIDVADALDIDERGAARALSGDKPIDIGDIIAIARSGPGGARLARRILSALRDSIDASE